MPGSSPPKKAGPDWLLWDGECGFCRRMVRWVVRRDRRGSFRAVPYQEAPSPPITPALRAACAEAVHVVRPDGEILRAGRACLYILERLGWGASRLLARSPWIGAVELGYRLLVRHRGPLGRLATRLWGPPEPGRSGGGPPYE